ncbi:hypothetical protein PLESTB_001013000 [Pleodorina starrii]|uniref:Ribosome-binding factor A n=1 Tax=Pleodorina starrii TaxID=330485 RepID=A0A9W6BQE4_9CHLO|nr:hypothetical protein PLESTM_001194400 [Pleodorina starrii]GLC55671.1 hypothetical protein PLESTB_001013000 [Pleodorina starrii]GLC65421.1 hypothetical protein PLESTF_000291500 [Pleodorina starrii]
MSCPWLLSGLGARAPLAAPSPSATCAPPACRPIRTLQCRWIRKSSCTASRQRLQVVCMAHPRRVARVSSQIQREIGEMFITDPVIQGAICPERKGGGDTLSAVASITNTYVSNDLQVVKVFVSVYSDDYGKRVAMQNLTRLEPYVRSLIGQRVRLRRTPEVRFVYDDSEEEADLVYRVLGRAEVERYRSEIEAETMAGAGAAPGGAADRGQEEGTDEQGLGDEDEEEEDEDWDEEDPDELPQAFPNPFGDLFEEQVVVQPVGRGNQGQAAAGAAGRGNRGRGRAGRASGRGGRGGGRGRGGSGKGWDEKRREAEGRGEGQAAAQVAEAQES